MSKFIKHIPCEACGSIDNMAVYQAEDSTYNASCFGCQHYLSNINEDGNSISDKSVAIQNKEETMEFKTEAKIDLSAISSLPSKGIRERCIVSNVAKYYGLKVAMMGTGDEITHHFSPYTKDNIVVGYQKREVATKTFSAIGHAKNDIQLQGQHLWSNGGGRVLTITEGFLDALAASQIMSGKEDIAQRFPVVSLPNGGNTACVVNNLNWINSFEKVVLMLDQDDTGVKTAKEISKMLAPGKAHIAQFSEKDACDMLIKGKEKEFTAAFWGAQPYSPADIVTSADAIAIINEKKDDPCYMFPAFAKMLNTMSYGVRLGEITLLTSGTGNGKTQFARESNYDLLMNTDFKIGICSLEESTSDVFLGLLSLHMNKRVHLPDVKVEDKDKDQSMKEIFTDLPDRLYVLDHQGSSADDDLISRVRYLIAVGCKFITIDHITVAVSEAMDTNRAIDKFMSELLKLAKAHNVHFTVVSHLRKVGSGAKSFEEGAVPSLDDLKGSGSIKQIAFNVIAFSRDRMEEDPDLRNTTKIHLLKSRYGGRSGYAGSFKFDDDTGRLEERFDADEMKSELTIKKKETKDSDFVPF